MPLTIDRIHEITDSITAQLDTVIPTGLTWESIVDYLDNELGTDPTPEVITYRSSINLTWDDANGLSSGIALTTNRPSLNNPINFSVEELKTARTIMFVEGNTVKGVMEMASVVTGITYGTGVFFPYFRITLSEV